MPNPWPALILAADHRARGVITIEPYDEYIGALSAAMTRADGILATVKPLEDLVARGAVTKKHRTYLSINRTGLANTAFELDDRLVASVHRAKVDGYAGVKHMTRIDRSSSHSAEALELLGQVLEEARFEGLDAMIESLVVNGSSMSHEIDDVIYAAVVAHDMGAPLLKVPVPTAEPGRARSDAVRRVVRSVGVPVLFLGGPMRDNSRQSILDEVRDVIDGGGAGMAMGRTVFQDPDPEDMAGLVAGIIHG
jgi:DhnA family fructose-bisphosphate aldolase class Ia